MRAFARAESSSRNALVVEYSQSPTKLCHMGGAYGIAKGEHLCAAVDASPGELPGENSPRSPQARMRGGSARLDQSRRQPTPCICSASADSAA